MQCVNSTILGAATVPDARSHKEYTWRFCVLNQSYTSLTGCLCFYQLFCGVDCYINSNTTLLGYSSDRNQCLRLPSHWGTNIDLNFLPGLAFIVLSVDTSVIRSLGLRTVFKLLYVLRLEIILWFSAFFILICIPILSYFFSPAAGQEYDEYRTISSTGYNFSFFS